MRRLIASALMTAVLFAAVGIAATTLVSLSTTPAEAAACRCPLIYAPVLCDHGRTFPNQCVADCHNAKNCVPIGL